MCNFYRCQIVKEHEPTQSWFSQTNKPSTEVESPADRESMHMESSRCSDSHPDRWGMSVRRNSFLCNALHQSIIVIRHGTVNRSSHLFFLFSIGPTTSL